MAEDTAPTVFVDLYKSPEPAKTFVAAFGPRRPQRWRWRAVNGGNNRVLAVSSEAYTNADDCIDAIDQLFGAHTDVWLRQDGEGNQLLRLATQDD